MIIIGCDFHPSGQQVYGVDDQTGEVIADQWISHQGEELERFYSSLPAGSEVGVESSGNMLWFERRLARYGHKLRIGDAAQIRSKETRKQKHDRRDAELIARLMLEKRFPELKWVPSLEERDQRQLLMHRHKLVRMRAQVNDNATDRKVRYQVTLINVNNIQPRETVTLGIEVRDVEQTAAALTAFVAEQGGQTTQANLSRERGGQVTAKLVFDVPLQAASALTEKFKAAGIVRRTQASRNPQVPAGKLAIARLDVTLSNAELIIPDEEGVWPQVRAGLKTSFVAIAWSLTVVIIGVCFVLPWALVLYGGYVVVNWLRRRGAATVP